MKKQQARFLHLESFELFFANLHLIKSYPVLYHYETAFYLEFFLENKIHCFTMIQNPNEEFTFLNENLPPFSAFDMLDYLFQLFPVDEKSSYLSKYSDAGVTNFRLARQFTDKLVLESTSTVKEIIQVNWKTENLQYVRNYDDFIELHFQHEKYEKLRNFVVFLMPGNYFISFENLQSDKIDLYESFFKIIESAQQQKYPNINLSYLGERNSKATALLFDVMFEHYKQTEHYRLSTIFK